MTIGEHQTSFGGKPVKDYEGEGELEPRKYAYRAAVDYDAIDEGRKLTDVLGQLLDARGADELEALLIGQWDYDSSTSSEAIVEQLCAAGDRLPKLRSLFLGDITFEEQEMSWIPQADISPLFTALPQLRELRVRGSAGLEVGTIVHDGLELLAFESGGLPRRILERVAHASLPALRHLELWLGDSNYGYDDGLAELGPILAGQAFPSLEYLGLKNAEVQDDVAKAVADAPVLDRIRALDLGMGTLSDEGATALLASPRVAKLERLAFAHHYVSDDLVKQLEALGPKVDASDRQEADQGEYRYVAVSE